MLARLRCGAARGGARWPRATGSGGQAEGRAGLIPTSVAPCSGLYLGTAVAAGLGGIIVDGVGAVWLPFAAALALLLAWVSASFRTPPSTRAAA